ncbi:MAG: flagellum-specific ATP synthase FliI, partial [Micavibrio aeruginosavorus]
MERLTDKALASIKPLPVFETHGTVVKVLGLLVEITGFGKDVAIGSVVHLRPKPERDIPCEVIGFRENRALLMPFGTLEGVGL